MIDLDEWLDGLSPVERVATRKRLGLTRADIAKLFGTHESTVRDLEADERDKRDRLRSAYAAWLRLHTEGSESP